MPIIIGDVHGFGSAYRKAVADSEASIQVGDFGLGFDQDDPLPDLGPGHRFIRGNHDNPALCRAHPRWIPDGTIERTDANTIMFVGGAKSRDSVKRVENIGWWRDEQLSIPDLENMLDLYVEARPTIMITHDCPWSIEREIFNHVQREFHSCTQQAFEIMFQGHQPDYWIFGHYHHSVRQTINGTHFICLGINETLDMEF